MFEIGTRVRIIKPLYRRMPMPIVGTEAEVIANPNPPSKWDPPGSEEWVWVRVDKRVPHGLDSDPDGTSYGLHDMDGSVWLVDSDDFDDDQRAFFRLAFDADCLELATEPSSVVGFEEALREAWKLEVDRARAEERRISDELHQQIMESIGSSREDGRLDLESYEALLAKKDAHREAGVQGQINWDNCLKAVGLI